MPWESSLRYSRGFFLTLFRRNWKVGVAFAWSRNHDRLLWWCYLRIHKGNAADRYVQASIVARPNNNRSWVSTSVLGIELFRCDDEIRMSWKRMERNLLLEVLIFRSGCAVWHMTTRSEIQRKDDKQLNSQETLRFLRVQRSIFV